MRTILTALLLTAAGLAQPTVAPTPAQVGPVRGDNTGDYNIVNSFETGYRFRTVGGDFDSYRSIVNYGDGIRLLGSSLSINSKDGHGRFFDEIVLTTVGLGNDPYESAVLRIQKNRLYRYDLTWRSNDYYNPGLRTGGATSPHLLDTIYHTQDQDLTLFPQSNIKFFLGYTRDHQEGPALSTETLFGSAIPGNNEFPLFENVRRIRNEYRIGNEFKFFGIRVNWIRGWEDFKEDSPYVAGAGLGLVPNNPTTVTSFQRNEPIHGTSPYWRVGLFSDHKWFSVNGRFTYTSGNHDFILDETALGTARFGAAQNQQVVTFGDAERPVATGNLNISLYPTSKLTITNSTSVYSLRMVGNSTFEQFNNATLGIDFVNFQYLGIRYISNETDVNYQPTTVFGFYGGYQYTDRLIRSREDAIVQGTISGQDANQTNHLHDGIFGIRLRPIRPLTILLDSEVGSADTPFAPVSDGNYHTLGARVQYKLKTLTLSAYTRANYNLNAVALSTYASHARTYAANAAWSPRDWFTVDMGYSKLHLNTAGGIFYFANGQPISGEDSVYFSNIHTANVGARFGLRKYADLYVGYSHVQDTGDGRGNPLGKPVATSLPALQAAQTFPMLYLSPMARLSVRISERVRWNIGYQYYGFREDFYTGQGFRSNTGYSSILWSF